MARTRDVNKAIQNVIQVGLLTGRVQPEALKLMGIPIPTQADQQAQQAQMQQRNDLQNRILDLQTNVALEKVKAKSNQETEILKAILQQRTADADTGTSQSTGSSSS